MKQIAFRRKRQRRLAGRSRAGFTLIEAALTTVIIGTGVLAILAAQQAYHRKNDWAARTGTAMLLANELRELTMTLPFHDPISGDVNFGPEAAEDVVAKFNDLDDFAGTVNASGYGAGTTFSPPINALALPVANMPGWSQFIEVENVLPGYLSASLTQPLGTTDMMRLRVTVLYQSPQDADPVPVTQLTWVRGR